MNQAAERESADAYLAKVQAISAARKLAAQTKKLDSDLVRTTKTSRKRRKTTKTAGMRKKTK